MPESTKTGSKRSKRGNQRVAAQAAILCVLLLLAGGAVVLAEWLCYQAGRKEYEAVAKQYVETVVETAAETKPERSELPEPGPFPFPDNTDSVWEPSPRLPDVSALANGTQAAPSRIAAIDFASLQAGNPDCVAWLEIPGTRISYPVMYREGDGGYYLTHTYEQTEAKAGAVHIDGASAGTDSRNMLVYGHTLLDGTMFSDLHKYKNQSFYQHHPYIYLHLPDGSVRRYQVAACVLTEGEQSCFYLWDFADDTSAQAYYDRFMEQSLYPTGISVDAGEGKRTLVLSTCTRRIYRRLIFAIEI